MRRALALAAVVWLAGLPAIGRDVPFLAGRVNDTARMLSAEEATRLEATLEQLERSTGAQVVVLTIDSLGDEVLEDYSMKVAETWKLGRRGEDDGALLLIARDDRKMRLEVGYGLEDEIPDAASRRILDNVVRPHFKRGEFGRGIEAGVDAIAAAIRGEAPPAEAVASGEDMPLGARIGGMLIFAVVIGVFSLVAIFGKGCQAWFLYLFLMPFYLAFPLVLIGPAGLVLFIAWLIGFPIAKALLRSPGGRSFLAAHPGLVTFASSSGSSRSGWSSSGGGFSGGGGSFGGGGSSSSW